MIAEMVDHVQEAKQEEVINEHTRVVWDQLEKLCESYDSRFENLFTDIKGTHNANILRDGISGTDS